MFKVISKQKAVRLHVCNECFADIPVGEVVVLAELDDNYTILCPPCSGHLSALCADVENLLAVL